MDTAAKIVAKNLELLRLHEPDKPSETEFAKRVGLQQRTYNRIKNGESEASLSSIQTVANKMRLHPWQLLVEDFHPDHPPELAPVGNTTEMYAHLRALSKLLPSSK